MSLKYFGVTFGENNIGSNVLFEISLTCFMSHKCAILEAAQCYWSGLYIPCRCKITGQDHFWALNYYSLTVFQFNCTIYDFWNTEG